VLKKVSLRDPDASDEQNPVDNPRKEKGIGKARDGRGVYYDMIVTLSQRFDKPGHPL